MLISERSGVVKTFCNLTWDRFIAMKCKLKLLSTASVLVIAISGCLSTASQSSPEFVRDPLGIGRAIDNYYFPDGAPAANSDPGSDATEREVRVHGDDDFVEMDNQP